MNKEYSNNFLKLFKPYSFRNWNKELFKISITYHEVRISPEELCLLVDNPEKYEDRDLLKELPFFKDLEALIEKEYKGKSFFSKFFSRSAKRLWRGSLRLSLHSGRNLLRLFKSF